MLKLIMAVLGWQVRLMEDRGYQLGNLDATIIAQKPKLSPFKEQIRNNLASLLGAHPSVINLKVSSSMPDVAVGVLFSSVSFVCACCMDLCHFLVLAWYIKAAKISPCPLGR